ncbi:unnamed protein product [Fusarium fujikuroi]|nr:unnamed protein product [Fusarium fujikuroi]
MLAPFIAHPWVASLRGPSLAIPSNPQQSCAAGPPCTRLQPISFSQAGSTFLGVLNIVLSSPCCFGPTSHSFLFPRVCQQTANGLKAQTVITGISNRIQDTLRTLD